MQTLAEETALAYAKPVFASFKLAALTRRFAVKVHKLQSEYTSAAHFHDFPQLWYCREGRCIFTIGDEDIYCETGTLVIVPPGQIHSIAVNGGADSVLVETDISFHFYQGADMVTYIHSAAYLFLLGYARELEMELPNVFALNAEAREAAESLFEELIKAEKNTEANIDAVYGRMEAFFRRTEFALPRQYIRGLCKLIDTKVAPVLRVLRFINEKWMEKISIEEVLAVSAFSRSSFSIHFKNFTALSFKGYLQFLRCRYINLLLGTTNYPVSYISDICGFSNRSHMLKAYKKLEDDTPVKMREEYRRYYNTFDFADIKPLLDQVV